MLEEFFISANNGFSIKAYGNSFAGNFVDFICGRKFNSALFRFRNNAFCDGVVGKSFRRCGIFKNFLFGKTFFKFNFRNAKDSGSKSSGLIKNSVFNVSKAFAIFRTLYYNSVLRSRTDSRE